ncbi:biotin/lipoyl-binding protein [Verrucomicrobium spinosum]|uniref:biotin/lipoyl-binding protein n=1 Tax=Verrucomicrobium spinosum TaxID=2736 RepID=UPI000A8172B7|nr:biotin/lipoyl-binding protein [Verrucomicrobium spinosum]
MKIIRWIGAFILIAAVASGGLALAAWKRSELKKSAAEAANQPEPMETVIVAAAKEREHRRVTTSIGTVLAMRSITLRNEIAGTVERAALKPGQIVEAGTVLVALDVSVEEAELRAQEAQAALAETTLKRMEKLAENRATPEMELDRARQNGMLHSPRPPARRQ